MYYYWQNNYQQLCKDSGGLCRWWRKEMVKKGRKISRVKCQSVLIIPSLHFVLRRLNVASHRRYDSILLILSFLSSRTSIIKLYLHLDWRLSFSLEFDWFLDSTVPLWVKPFRVWTPDVLLFVTAQSFRLHFLNSRMCGGTCGCTDAQALVPETDWY